MTVKQIKLCKVFFKVMFFILLIFLGSASLVLETTSRGRRLQVIVFLIMLYVILSYFLLILPDIPGVTITAADWYCGFDTEGTLGRAAILPLGGNLSPTCRGVRAWRDDARFMNCPVQTIAHEAS